LPDDEGSDLGFNILVVVLKSILEARKYVCGYDPVTFYNLKLTSSVNNVGREGWIDDESFAFEHGMEARNYS
jgi:hypothetical protein